MHVAHIVLHTLGANEVPMNQSDPQTEEEFQLMQYTSPTPISWVDYQAKYTDVLQTTALRQLRAERNSRIAKSDWIMTIDNVETLANKQAWIAYRQALRDLPDHPPAFVWNGPTLHFSQMTLPVEPPVIRITAPSSVSPQSSE